MCSKICICFLFSLFVVCFYYFFKFLMSKSKCLLTLGGLKVHILMNDDTRGYMFTKKIQKESMYVNCRYYFILTRPMMCTKGCQVMSSKCCYMSSKCDSSLNLSLYNAL